MVFYLPHSSLVKSDLLEIESNETETMCVCGTRVPESPGCRPSDWTRQELTSSWLAMYLGSYFDRRYHCERGDKLS